MLISSHKLAVGKTEVVLEDGSELAKDAVALANCIHEAVKIKSAKSPELVKQCKTLKLALGLTIAKLNPPSTCFIIWKEKKNTMLFEVRRDGKLHNCSIGRVYDSDNDLSFITVSQSNSNAIKVRPLTGAR